MLLWLLFALMTAGVIAVLLRPLMQGAAAGVRDAQADIAVYKDQLSEIDADAARGLVTPADAELARREVARRLLARAQSDTTRASRIMPVRPLLGTIATVLPLLAISTYVWLGTPHLPDQPRSALPTAPLDRTPVGELVAKVEARLVERPDDGKGWDVIAPIYFRQERFAEAAHAYGRASALLGETPARLAGFAEATVLANNGIVTDVARAAYEKLAKADPDRVEPKFWLALALEQDGKRTEAAAAYKAILAAAPPGANWRPLIEERIAAVEKTSAATVPAIPTSKGGAATSLITQSPPRGPSAADMKAAEKMSDADRAEMIRGMVASLAQRLADNPSDMQGWQRLMQSYIVLGDRANAEIALGDARRRLAGNQAALTELSAIAKSLGLGS